MNNNNYDDSNLASQPLFYATSQQPQQPVNQLLTSTDDANSRLAACSDCEHYRKGLRQCSICNCIMPVKVRFQKAKCPDGRW